MPRLLDARPHTQGRFTHALCPAWFGAVPPVRAVNAYADPSCIADPSCVAEPAGAAAALVRLRS